MDQVTAEEALKRLEPLIGDWALELVLPSGERLPGKATTSFEWHSSGAHVVQLSMTDVPEAPNVVAIMGCDAANGTYSQLYSDSRGVCRVYEMSIDASEWKLWRVGEPFPQRFLGRFEDDGNTIAGRWEKAMRRLQLRAGAWHRNRCAASTGRPGQGCGLQARHVAADC